MKVSSYQNWIDTGYEIFACKGLDGIVIESIANKLRVSKSTFYHHFGSHQYFLEILLEEHFERAKIMAKKARTIKTFIPGFLNLLMEHKADILFNKHLRDQRENQLFQLYFQKAASIVSKEVQNIWAQFIGLTKDTETSGKLYRIIQDLFYQRITQENFTAEWMETLS